MRLWSIHPKYLDSKGLVALWREALLAQKVLLGKTKGYKHHPQLMRFQAADNSTEAIACYLRSVLEEADLRGYQFNRNKILAQGDCSQLEVTKGQLEYEFQHLMSKLESRDVDSHDKWKSTESVESHPMFKMVEGDVEDWEVIPTSEGDLRR